LGKLPFGNSFFWGKPTFGNALFWEKLLLGIFSFGKNGHWEKWIGKLDPQSNKSQLPRTNIFLIQVLLLHMTSKKAIKTTQPLATLESRSDSPCSITKKKEVSKLKHSFHARITFRLSVFCSNVIKKTNTTFTLNFSIARLCAERELLN